MAKPEHLSPSLNVRRDLDTNVYEHFSKNSLTFLCPFYRFNVFLVQRFYQIAGKVVGFQYRILEKYICILPKKIFMCSLYGYNNINT